MSKNLIPTKLRSGDEVIVIAGKDIGKKGTLREIVRSKNKAIVTGINIVTVSYTHLTLPTNREV